MIKAILKHPNIAQMNPTAATTYHTATIRPLLTPPPHSPPPCKPMPNAVVSSLTCYYSQRSLSSR